MSNELPEALGRLHAAFPSEGRDVPIPALYGALFPGLRGCPEDAQQRIGPYITRLNRRLKGRRLRIVPGVARRSYRLAAL